MTRKDAIKYILDSVSPQDVIVSSTGMTSRELYAIKDRELNFYMLGSMGNALAIGMGIAMNSKRKVIVINGDASALMSLGTMITHNSLYPPNLFHYILDNNAHNSTGGQKTVSDKVNFKGLAPNTKVLTITNDKSKLPRIPYSCKEIANRFKKTLNNRFDMPMASILIQ